MEQTQHASTVEMDNSGFDDLKDQILDGRSLKAAVKEEDIREKQQPQEAKKQSAPTKKNIFSKGEQTVELDDDYEVELMADKRPMKLSLRELKERASGDIAVKNRMHALAEEKKRVQATFKEFASMAKEDPLGALEFISSKAKEADSEFEYNRYIEKLAEQAESLGKMDEKDRKSLELEKKLKKAEQDLSHKEREAAVVQRKQTLLADYPEIGDQEFGQMVDAVLSNEELLDGLENEKDVMDKVEELIQETLTQRDIMSIIEEVNPQHLNDNQLIFSLSDQLKQNPDLDEEDVRDIIRALIAPVERIQSPATSTQRQQDIKTLSSKQRQSMTPQQYRTPNATPYQILEQQLLENKEKIKRTPIQLR